MTQPTGEAATEVALRMLGEQMGALRVTVHDEISAVRGDINRLSAEVHAHIPRIAVLEHRADGADAAIKALSARHDKELAELRAERQADHTERRASTATKVAVSGALVAALVAIVFGILNLTIGA
jgi:hypothetical protein